MTAVSRATKIVATIGPASSSPERIKELVAAGVDVFRLNFSHGSADEHRERARLIRAEALAQGRSVAVLVDLQGPKIRVGKFADGKVSLASGAPFRFDTHDIPGDTSRVGLAKPGFFSS